MCIQTHTIFRRSWSGARRRDVVVAAGAGGVGEVAGVVSTWSLLWPVIIFAGCAAGIFVVYWTIRLAVRHGIDDARRHREEPTADDPRWDPARF